MKYFRILWIIMIVLLVGCGSKEPVTTPVPDTPEPSPTVEEAPQPTMTEPAAETLEVEEEAAPEEFPATSGMLALTVFAPDGLEVFTVDYGQQQITQLTDNQMYSLDASWSPDGSQLAYWLYDQAALHLKLMVIDMADGGETREVSSSFTAPVHANWSGDGKYMSFSDSEEQGGQPDIYRVDMMTGEIVNLTADSPHWDYASHWSPTQDEMVFVSDRPTEAENFDSIWLMAGDGSGATMLTDPGTDWENKYPAFSPDGEKIAFFRSKTLGTAGEEPDGLYQMNRDGSDLTLVTEMNPFGVFSRPVWSPDGKYLTYALGLDETGEIYLVPADGSRKPENISNLPGLDRDISWMAGSQFLTFTNVQADNYQVFLVDITDPEAIPVLPGFQSISGVWRP